MTGYNNLTLLPLSPSPLLSLSPFPRLPLHSCSELRDAIARWTIAFVRLSKLHLREHGDVRLEMAGVLRGEELPLVAAAAHRPLAAAHVLSELLRSAEAAGRLSDQSRARLEADVNMLSQALGACEKVNGWVVLAWRRWGKGRSVGGMPGFAAGQQTSRRLVGVARMRRI